MILPPQPQQNDAMNTPISRGSGSKRELWELFPGSEGWTREEFAADVRLMVLLKFGDGE